MSDQPTVVLPPQPTGDPPAPPRAAWRLGAIGVALAVCAAGFQVAGVAVASNLDWERGTLLAWLAIGASVAAFVVGLVAVIVNRGRRWGAVAMAAAVVANPFLLARILELLG